MWVQKPDLAAPGVGVMTAKTGGGYGEYTGTSFAVPFVTGSAALLMEWGIVRGNDPYLYGEKGAEKHICEEEQSICRGMKDGRIINWGMGRCV